jgi:hypothetical protein
VPPKLRVAEVFTVEGVAQITGVAVNVGIGTGFTVIVWVVVADKQAEEPGLRIAKVIVLVPGEFQLILKGPWVKGKGEVTQPSQFHV